MKTQMRFQKILMYVSLVVAALTFVFGLIFLSGSMAYATHYTGGNSIGAEKLVEKSQAFVETMVAVGITFIVLAALLFVTSSHSRKNYYITNYIAVGLFVAFAMFMAIFIMIKVTTLMGMFYNDITWDNVADKIAALAGLYPIKKSDNYPFIIGYIVAALTIFDALLVVLCTVWKVLLMKGEKKLLEGSAKVEAEEVA